MSWNVLDMVTDETISRESVYRLESTRRKNVHECSYCVQVYLCFNLQHKSNQIDVFVDSKRPHNIMCRSTQAATIKLFAAFWAKMKNGWTLSTSVDFPESFFGLKMFNDV